MKNTSTVDMNQVPNNQAESADNAPKATQSNSAFYFNAYTALFASASLLAVGVLVLSSVIVPPVAPFIVGNVLVGAGLLGLTGLFASTFFRGGKKPSADDKIVTETLVDLGTPAVTI